MEEDRDGEELDVEKEGEDIDCDVDVEELQGQCDMHPYDIDMKLNHVGAAVIQ